MYDVQRAPENTIEFSPITLDQPPFMQSILGDTYKLQAHSSSMSVPTLKSKS